MSHIALAECIRLAANIRESSYDHTKSAAMINGDPTMYGYASELCYGKTLKQACEEAEASWATHKGWGEVTYMLLNQNWNEALDWANGVLANQAPSDTVSQSA